jgi:hypothetical protein
VSESTSTPKPKQKLCDLEPGDDVIVYHLSIGSTPEIARIEMATKSHFIVSGFKYRKDTGHMAERRTSSRSFLNIAAPELLAEIRSKIRRKKMLAELQAVEWKKLPDEILAAVIALLSDSGKTDGRDGHDQTH